MTQKRISGRVEQGAGRGRELGYPTANIPLETPGAIEEGVYAVHIMISPDSYEHQGVAFLGSPETFQDKQRRLEIHFFDDPGKLLGRELTVMFVEKIREPRTFPSPEELVAAIEDDIEKARGILSSRTS